METAVVTQVQYPAWVSIVGLVLGVCYIIGLWKVFAKAGEAGWKSLIPLYNGFVAFKIGWKTSMFWIILGLSLVSSVLTQFFPGQTWAMVLGLVVGIANVVLAVMFCINLSKSFGHGAGFGWGLFLLGPIFIMILGFGKSVYAGNPSAPAAAE